MANCKQCGKKHMKVCAFYEPLLASAAMPYAAQLAQPMAVKHDYRNVKIAENATITIDVEKLKKKMVDDIYCALGFGLNYGA